MKMILVNMCLGFFCVLGVFVAGAVVIGAGLVVFAFVGGMIVCR